ncbi:GDSL-type esterase/lipase family protein [Phenylobacterium aquaticum]|uniref:GDSL-type esterase/lipase family protein n=1 Tax=Phenylobacterium aquaticum TaxID=1763816 RepID=UPI0026EE99B1|nr:GDSL-type esterase/lipase family protein [Phenylobacterium aquaticum]
MTGHRLRPRHLGLALAFSALGLIPSARAAEATPPGPIGMVDQPCLAGAYGRSPEMLAFAVAAVADGPVDGKAMAALAKDAPERARLDAWREKNDWADLCRYRLDNAEVLKAGPVRVVFLGDSITELWRAADPAFFSGGVVNRGISGQTSGQLLIRFEQDVVALHPKAVHILIGTNDVAGNNGPERPEDLKNNLRAMVAIARTNHIRVILGAIPPAGTFSWRPALHPAAQIVELNTWIAAYAKAQGLALVDYHMALAGPDGAMKPGVSRDGVHPLKSGYALMKPLAEKAIGGPALGRAGRP